MNYWILALPREDMDQCINVGVFGLNKNFLLGHVRIGDKVACYVTKEYKIIALGEMTREYYLDIEKVFKREGAFPDRIGFKASRFGSNQEIDFMNIIDRMSFIKNRTHWSVYFRNGITRISKEDWDILNNSVPEKKQLTAP